MRPSILIVEDDRKLAQAIREGFATECWNTSVAERGEEGFTELALRDYDALVLDLMLPGRSGMEILREIRETENPIPILILSARDGVDDRVAGLENGADGYLVKPFAIQELVARMRALLRREKAGRACCLRLADLALDMVVRRARRGQQVLRLSSKEIDLLGLLLMYPHAVVSRGMIARHLWGESNTVSEVNNIIDVHMTRLRRKVDNPFPVKLVRTVRGAGFMLTDRNDSQAMSAEGGMTPPTLGQ